LLLAAAVLFMRDKGSRKELARAETRIGTLSNEVSTANTRVMLLVSITNQLNLHISNHLARVVNLSNRVSKVSDDLKNSQQENATAKTDLDKQTKKANDGDLRITELDTEVRTLRKMLE